MEGSNRTFLGDLSREVLIGLLVLLVLAGVGLVWGLGLIGAILIVVIVGGVALAINRRVPERVRSWRRRRRINRMAPVILREMLSYMTHLRDVQKTFLRARTDRPAEIRGRIRREILEAMRGLMTTPPGCEVKAVWFRPDPDGRHLYMYEQVGHSPEGQAALRLQIGGSFAGEAFVTGEAVWSNECETDPSFQDVELGKAAGSLACVPIAQGNQVTGVLSVLANWHGAFWASDIAYFGALASSIGALEALEEGGSSADT